MLIPVPASRTCAHIHDNDIDIMIIMIASNIIYVCTIPYYALNMILGTQKKRHDIESSFCGKDSILLFGII